VRPHLGAERVAGGRQQLVADGVAVLGIDRPETVDVEHRGAQRPPVTTGALDLDVELRPEAAEVQEAGDGVVARLQAKAPLQIGDLPLGVGELALEVLSLLATTHRDPLSAEKRLHLTAATTRSDGPAGRHPARHAESVRDMVVMGIDPGTASTGYGVVRRRDGRLIALDGGVIATPSTGAPEARLAAIYERVCGLLDEHLVQDLAVEDVYFGQNARSAFAVGQARGVVMLAAGRRAIPCASYTPQQVKGAVCGSGRAAKAQVQQMVGALLGLPDPPVPDHAADALAVAICHLNRAPLAAALARA
jgi:crossover junction endodeoxyribonuclease RuvC